MKRIVNRIDQTTKQGLKNELGPRGWPGGQDKGEDRRQFYPWLKASKFKVGETIERVCVGHLALAWASKSREGRRCVPY
jgi:hypothetical protein